MSPTPNPSDPFGGLPLRTSLMRTKRRRAVLPPVAALDANHGLHHFTADDLKAILKEALRQRRWWRLRHYLRLILIAAFLTWSLWILPGLAFRFFPFERLLP